MYVCVYTFEAGLNMLRFRLRLILCWRERRHRLLRIFHRWMRAGKLSNLVSRNAYLSGTGGGSKGVSKKTRETFSRAWSSPGYWEKRAARSGVFDRVPLLLKVVTNFLKMYGFKGRPVERGAIVSRNLVGKNEVNPMGLLFLERRKGSWNCAVVFFDSFVSLLCISAMRENR